MAGDPRFVDLFAIAQDVTSELQRIRVTVGTSESLSAAGQLLAAALAFITTADSASRAMLVLASQLSFLHEVEALQRAETAARVIH